MFKFGFSKEEEDDVPKCKEEAKSTNWLQSEEITMKNNVVPPELLEDGCPDVMHIEIENVCTIRHVSVDVISEMIRKKKDSNNSIFKADQDHSDLITAIYEGGLKIWQCTYDLLEYILDLKPPFIEKKVLDLGCGAGIIGIFAMLNDASAVYFQDYNPEVLRYITLPNVLLNRGNAPGDLNCRFYSGDWKSFLDITKDDFQTDDDKFDYIFTSETIYNRENFQKLNSVFKKRLKKNGTIYLAAKTYYFGVGGGTREFECLLKADDVFKYEIVWKQQEGVSREILKIVYK